MVYWARCGAYRRQGHVLWHTTRSVSSAILYARCTIPETDALWNCFSDCEWKAQAGNVCVASFDWKCSGVCNPVERLKYVHSRCSEGEDAIWSASFWLGAELLMRVHRLKRLESQITRLHWFRTSGIYRHCDTSTQAADGSSLVFPGRLLCLEKEIKRSESYMFDNGRNSRDTSAFFSFLFWVEK